AGPPARCRRDGRPRWIQGARCGRNSGTSSGAKAQFDLRGCFAFLDRKRLHKRRMVLSDLLPEILTRLSRIQREGGRDVEEQAHGGGDDRCAEAEGGGPQGGGRGAGGRRIGADAVSVDGQVRRCGLMIRRRKRKHCTRAGQPLTARTAANQEWALDFVHDHLEWARKIRWLVV